MSEDTIERLERLLNRNVDKLVELHEEFVTFRAEMKLIVNGGPGKSDACEAHKDELIRLKRKVSTHDKVIIAWSACLTLIVFALQLFGPTIRAALKIHSP